MNTKKIARTKTKTKKPATPPRRPELYMAFNRASDVAARAKRATELLVGFVWATHSTGPTPSTLPEIFRELVLAEHEANDAAERLEDLGAVQVPARGEGGRPLVADGG